MFHFNKLRISEMNNLKPGNAPLSSALIETIHIFLSVFPVSIVFTLI